MKEIFSRCVKLLAPISITLNEVSNVQKLPSLMATIYFLKLIDLPLVVLGWTFTTVPHQNPSSVRKTSSSRHLDGRAINQNRREYVCVWWWWWGEAEIGVTGSGWICVAWNDRESST
ncbi:hypothetical protein AVEN_218177-1 [Araneus ventricosus]|uniref:Uncharacterized protein n=1 Tax=Araneus ventricosus TaxID=182803 RepID=A0A4Y2X882_ARAVE|nr:hypothetical protein AVEN_218177-1 [Araneus ventricosus]